jgi:hypothetical protein
VLIVCHAGPSWKADQPASLAGATCYITFPAFDAAVITPFG